MTNVAAQQPCERCGGKLVPPELMPLVSMSARGAPPPDYVCIKCGQPYLWEGNPPRLMIGSRSSTVDGDPSSAAVDPICDRLRYDPRMAR